MRETKRHKLEAAGWRIGSAADLLGLSREEESLIEMKLALASKLKSRRQRRKLTQVAVAEKIGSSQSRIAKMEIADKSVSLDLLVRSLLLLGASRQEIASAIGAHAAKGRGNRPSPKRHAAAS